MAAVSSADETSRPRWWGGSALGRLGDLGLAAVVGVLGVNAAYGSKVGLLSGGQVVVPVAVACVILFRRRFPLSATLAALLGWLLVGSVFAVPVASYTVARRYGAGIVTWVVTVVNAVGLVVGYVVPGASQTPGWGGQPLLIVAIIVVPFTVAPTVLGLWLRQRAELLTSLRERAAQAERERDLRAAQAVTEERTRIARELHDVVAHRISQITLQAGALEVASADPAVAGAAESIRTTGRTALEEMRELLSVLRTAHSEVPLHPVPTADGVRRLVDEASRAGQRVRVSMPGELPDLPGTTGRALYRLVQESLTNARKHAPGAEVDATIEVSEQEVTVSVRNGPAVYPMAPAAGSGFGLVGMRERVELADGRMAAGPRPGGGFLVTATLPRHRS